MSVMILQLVLVFLTACSRAYIPEPTLLIRAGVYSGGSHFNIPHAGTSDTIWVKHANNTAFPVGGINPSWYPSGEPFPWNQEVSVYEDTWVWTTGYDALLVDYFKLDAHDDVRQWGIQNRKGWCLSLDHWNDAAEFNWENWGPDGDQHVVPDWRCYSLLELNRDGLVYYYYDDNWRPNYYGTAHDRRALMEEADIPSVEDVKACEDDPNTDTNQECGPMVDQIINWEKEHWMKRKASQNGDEEDIADTDVGNTDTETATDDRRVLSALKRLLKA